MMNRSLFAGLLALLAIPALTACRALLDGDDLDLHRAESGGSGGREPNGSGGAGSPASSGTDGAPSSGPGAGGASTSGSTSTSSVTTSTSTADGGSGGATSTTSSSSSSTGSGGGASCGDAIDAAIELGATYALTGTNAGGDPAEVCVHDGPSRFIRMTPAADGFLSVWIRRDQSDYDTALGLGAACNVSDLCSNTTQIGAENAVIAATMGVPIWIAVSGSTPSDVGTFSLQATLDRGVCSDPIELHVEAASSGAVASIDLSGLNNHIEGSCGGGGDDVVFRVTGVGTPQASAYMTPLGFDAVLHTRPACDQPELECADLGGTSAAEEVPLSVSTPTFLFADSNVAGGLFTLTVFGE